MKTPPFLFAMINSYTKFVFINRAFVGVVFDILMIRGINFKAEIMRAGSVKWNTTESMSDGIVKL